MEKMDDFFAARAVGYDAHMLSEVEGCKEGYIKMAQLVPRTCETLLDLGCGTGLELDEIFKVVPKVHVTGIDMTKAMLDELRHKHEDKVLNLICKSYFDVPLGSRRYDCAISFQTMHHFSHEKKLGLYQKIYEALKEGGMYIECDYMVEKEEEEAFYYAENARIRGEEHIPMEAFYHYDTPCTINHQIELLEKAGFSKVEKIFRKGNTTIVMAYKLLNGMANNCF